MSDPLLTTVEEIRQVAKSDGLCVFFGWLVAERLPIVHWNEEHGGDWKVFLELAKTLKAKAVYLNWTPFEQFQVDDAVSETESKIADNNGLDDETQTLRELLDQIGKYKTKVGLVCVIDLAFVAEGISHIYQKTANWFGQFQDLLSKDADEEEEDSKPANKALVNKWATILASDPKFIISKDSRGREYLLEKIAGEEFPKLPTSEILSRAEAIYQIDFRQAAETRIADEVRILREQGLNVNAIALKLGMSRDRVSGLLPPRSPKK
jgi:hypothetical protein